MKYIFFFLMNSILQDTNQTPILERAIDSRARKKKICVLGIVVTHLIKYRLHEKKQVYILVA